MNSFNPSAHHPRGGQLVRATNYPDLSDTTRDHQRQVELQPADATDTSSEPAQSPISVVHYVNVDTQTSLDYEPEVWAAQRDELEAASSRSANIDDRREQTVEPPDGQDGRTMLILRQLLASERQINERRRLNNQALQEYLKQLQLDYLRQQRDLIEALELGHKIKRQKQTQIEVLSETINEKDKLVGQLRQQLDSLNGDQLRQEFEQLLEKQSQLHQMEKKQLKDQLSIVEQQMVSERVANSQILQQFHTKMDQQSETHEKQANQLRDRTASLEADLARIMNEPQHLLLRELREEKSQLVVRIDELTMMLDESQVKYESLRRKLECLLEEQEDLEQHNQAELENLQSQCVEQRKTINQLRMELEDRQEVANILQFNLQRCEKRSRSLMGAIKGKEAAYKDLIQQIHHKHQEEKEKISNEVHRQERVLIELSSDLDRKQNELLSLQLESENQLESIRNDRDARINRLQLDKQRLERELHSTEIKLAREIESSELKSNQVAQLKLEVTQFREESKRLSIELTKSDAKLFSKQQELSEILKVQEAASCEQVDRRVDIDEKLEECKRVSKRLEGNVKSLRKENESLRLKLKVSESNLMRVSASVNKEHGKIVYDYEKRLEQIKSELSIYDRNKIRYKRYGYKLKKYCEHLRRVHQHLCNPKVCGFIVSSAKTNVGNQTGDLKNHDCGKSPNSNGCDWDNSRLLTTDDEADNNDDKSTYFGNDVTNEMSKASGDFFVHQSKPVETEKSGKFSIKRTGSSVSSVKKTTRRGENFNESSKDHQYYYIDENRPIDPSKNSDGHHHQVIHPSLI